MIILITGASGYLAHRLVPIAAEHGEVFGAARQVASIVNPACPCELDITDESQVMALFAKLAPDAVIHAAACNPGANNNQFDAINRRGSENVARAASEQQARLVAVSTDIVHNGLLAPYADSATPDPINAYGRSKAQAEALIARHCPSAAIVRTSLIYGLDQPDRGTQGFIERVRAGETLTLFDDVIRQPVWVDTLAQSLVALAVNNTDVHGTINIAGDQALNRADFALRMLQHWGVQPASGQLQQANAPTDIAMPLDCRMLLDRAMQLGWSMPGVDDVLAQYETARPI